MQPTKIIFGTSVLGNLYEEISYEEKKAIIQEILLQHNLIQNNSHADDNNNQIKSKIIFDCAGKYGAGLALEVLGRILSDLNVSPHLIQISNKLGWRRIPLTTSQPTFEKNIWINIQHDARLDISYDGIMNAYHEGNQLLGKYSAKIVSIHDPDEYLHSAIDEIELRQRMHNLTEAYRALFELKLSGQVDSIGVGSKDYKTIQYISNKFSLDWVMTACSLTPFIHPSPHLAMLSSLSKRGVQIINSAVFNSGFLIGGEFFNYQTVNSDTHQELFEWRERFLLFCQQNSISPVHICIQFSFLFPFITSIALNACSVSQVRENIHYAQETIPSHIWQSLQAEGLISQILKDNL